MSEEKKEQEVKKSINNEKETKKEEISFVLSKPGDYSTVDFKEYLVVQTNDTPVVEVALRRSASQMCKLLKTLTVDQQPGDQTVMPLQVGKASLDYALIYMQYHHGNRAEPIKKPLTGKVEDNIGEWDKTFLHTKCLENGDEKKNKQLTKVMKVANYLQLKDLLDLTTACFVSICKGKSSQQIRDTFQLKNDFSTAEQKMIDEENSWFA